MKLYQKLDVPDFNIMVEELLELSKTQIEQNLRYWDIKFIEFYKNTPTFFKYISSNFYRLPILFRFYNTPPYGKLVAHIDNTQEAKNKIGFNFPLLGTTNTQMNFYYSPPDNVDLQYAGFEDMPVQLIKDKSKLILADSIEIDKPTLLRTDSIHEVVNNNNSYRLVLGMKFIGNTFEEVYKFNNN